MILNTKINKNEDAILISGVNDINLKMIEKKFEISIIIRGNDIIVSTEDEAIINKLEILFSKMLEMIEFGNYLRQRDVSFLLEALDNDESLELIKTNSQYFFKNNAGKPIYAKTLNQDKYLKNLNEKDIIFSIGPAGTGKTFLAVTYAVKMLKENKVKRIIMTRPAVEAGESLGFLPGDLKEKIDPYLRPLYDTLFEMLGPELTASYITKGIIEIAPLAYMRGRTLENACIILDEAQNTSLKQMKMFLTRLGFSSKMIITGDTTQIDLPKGVKSGLIEACNILDDIPEIAIMRFQKKDVVRNPLVKKILDRYEAVENENKFL